MRSLLILLALSTLVAAAPVRFEPFKIVRGSAMIDPTVTHDGQPALRIEAGRAAGDARVELAGSQLTLGKPYVLTAFVRTDHLTVEDHARSPIAIGAALTMASMPFDRHSASLGGTRDWTEIRLPFTAASAHDAIVLSAGLGGLLHGTAWFSDVRLEEAASPMMWPAKAALRTYGPAYRYPQNGWIYLHIEGAPYERGYQHGRLMSKEIETYLQRCASEIDPKSRDNAWESGRANANALFLRSFDTEILQEMKGIADGAADAGAKFGDRKVDLIDIVAANTLTELLLLGAAMPMTPTGLEMLTFEKPPYSEMKPAGAAKFAATDHCSAFCATGKATRDGHMVIAHVTMWPLTLAEQTNVMLDIQPQTGHRVLMQSYPGGIQSGTDWYQNDAGIVLTETTIRQSPFNINGLSVAYRARKAIQYGDSIDKVVEYLGTKNNGLYTNEWLIADARTDEIAMYELGTWKTRLYRSSKKDWFGGTEGFYWGDNNAKDLNVRLEYQPDPRGKPGYIPYVASERDLKWQNLFEKYRGQIDDSFAFLAFHSAPLVTASTMDAKVASAEMAKHMMVWAAFGKPNQREWVPTDQDKTNYGGNQGLYSGGYHLFSANAAPELRALVAENEKERLAERPKVDEAKRPEKSPFEDRLWKGWILPATNDDVWLVAGSTGYYRALEDKDYAKRIERMRAGYEAASRTDSNEISRYEQASFKGALLFDALRKQMGDDKFFAFMQQFFADHTTKPVSTAEFVRASAATEQKLINEWVAAEGIPGVTPGGKGAIYVATDIHPLSRRIGNLVLVYGTADEAGANRYAAEQIQKHLLDWFEDSVPLKKDFEVTDEDLRDHEVLFVGRPETNSALAAWQTKLGLDYAGAVFTVDGKPHAGDGEALVWAAANPLNAKHMVLVVAGNSPVETVRIASKQPEPVQFAVYENGKESSSGFAR